VLARPPKRANPGLKSGVTLQPFHRIYGFQGLAFNPELKCYKRDKRKTSIARIGAAHNRFRRPKTCKTCPENWRWPDIGV
jgi:hypothetical protein